MSNRKGGFVFRDEEVQDLLRRLDPKSLKGDILMALRAGAEYVAGRTEMNLLRKKITNAEALAKGIITWDEAEHLTVAVGITGDFRLNFFENGTAERTLRRSGKRLTGGGREAGSVTQYPMGARRGRINKADFGGFFADAVKDTDAIRRVVVRELELLIPDD